MSSARKRARATGTSTDVLLDDLSEVLESTSHAVRLGKEFVAVIRGLGGQINVDYVDGSDLYTLMQRCDIDGVAQESTAFDTFAAGWRENMTRTASNRLCGLASLTNRASDSTPLDILLQEVVCPPPASIMAAAMLRLVHADDAVRSRYDAFDKDAQESFDRTGCLGGGPKETRQAFYNLVLTRIDTALHQ